MSNAYLGNLINFAIEKVYQKKERKKPALSIRKEIKNEYDNKKWNTIRNENEYEDHKGNLALPHS